MTQLIWQLTEGDGPLVAAAIHHGHAVRPEVAKNLALSPADRLREEDPFTGNWTAIANTRVVGLRSRFEVDLNRPREKAVYRTPDDAWGLQVWKKPPPDTLLAQSLAQYDAFYTEMQRLFATLEQRYGHFVVFDLHSYNHRRNGPTATPDDPAQNPDVNLGTRSLPRDRWAAIVERFMADMQSFNFYGRQLDVRENIKFGGGQFARWTHQTFPQSGCVLSIEFKKFFMDEWTGEPDLMQLQAIQQALQFTVPGVLKELKKS